MAEQAKKMTRKEKIAAGVEKKPKRKTAMAARLKAERQVTNIVHLKNSPISDRKMRLVINLVRDMEVGRALNVLKHTIKGGAEPVRKLLISAISNWEQKNPGMRVEEAGLYIKQAFVDPSRQLKRFRPAPQGRANRISKRSNHVTLILGTKEESN